MLGLLLIGASAAFTGLLIAYNLGGGPGYTVSVAGNNLSTLNSLEIFLSGLALALLFGLGVVLLSRGVAWHRRREARSREAAMGTADREPAAPGHHRLHLFGH